MARLARTGVRSDGLRTQQGGGSLNDAAPASGRNRGAPRTARP